MSFHQVEHQEPSYTGCGDLIRRAFLRKNMTLPSANIIVASLSDSSLRQYDICYKKWIIFCKNNNLCVFEKTIPKIIQFLTEAFQSGSNYGTLNSYRSALSLILGSEIGQNGCVARFFKGVYKLRPPLPKYNVTWDTSCVLNHLETMGDNNSLHLKNLTKKCVTLLALITAHRVQTFLK